MDASERRRRASEEAADWVVLKRGSPGLARTSIGGRSRPAGEAGQLNAAQPVLLAASASSC